MRLYFLKSHFTLKSWWNLGSQRQGKGKVEEMLGIEAQTWSENREELSGLVIGVGGEVVKDKPRKKKSLKLGTL